MSDSLLVQWMRMTICHQTAHLSSARFYPAILKLRVKKRSSGRGTQTDLRLPKVMSK